MVGPRSSFAGTNKATALTWAVDDKDPDGNILSVANR